MRFKLKTRGIFLSIFLGLSACAINEGPPPVKSKNLKSDLTCLAHVQEQLDQFSNGTLKSSTQIDQMVQCASDALKTFRDRTRGEVRDQFKAVEIRNFLQRYFIDGFSISDQFLEQSMKVKQALIGGGFDVFSYTDIDSGIELIQRVGTVMKLLQPHMPFDLERYKKMPEKDVDSAAHDLQLAADLLSSLIMEKGVTYSLSDFYSLLGNLIQNFPKLTVLKTVRDNLQIVASIKAVFVSPTRAGRDYTFSF